MLKMNWYLYNDAKNLNHFTLARSYAIGTAAFSLMGIICGLLFSGVF